MIEPCYTCRRRHIECDRSQIPCRKCQKAGLACYDKRPVRWVRGVAIRGTMRGRSYQGPSVSSSRTPARSVVMDSIVPLEADAGRQLCVTASAISQFCGGTDMASNTAESIYVDLARPSDVPASMTDIAISRLDAPTRYYLDYYNARICDLFIVYDSEKNPFRSLIPLALDDSVLLDAVLALAARHHANVDQAFSPDGVEIIPDSTSTDHDALRFKCRAIQGLSRSLNGERPCPKDSTVASIFLLVFLDLLESGCDRWNYHLEGAKTLMTLTEPLDPGRTVQGIRQFIIKQIHLIETLGATFVRPQLLSRSISIEESVNQLEDVIEQSFLGCPEYILTALQFFSLQRDIIASGDPSDHAPIHEIMSVLDGVKDFDCYLWASTRPQESVTRDIGELCKLARAYQLGAVLYGQRVLDALGHHLTAQDSTVCELIGVIGNLKQGSTLLKCVLWPIVIAGLESQTQSQRDFLMLSLEKFWIDTRCLNVMNAAKILRSYWDRMDEKGAVTAGWIFDIGQLSHDWLLI